MYNYSCMWIRNIRNTTLYKHTPKTTPNQNILTEGKGKKGDLCDDSSKCLTCGADTAAHGAKPPPTTSAPHIPPTTWDPAVPLLIQLPAEAPETRETWGRKAGVNRMRAPPPHSAGPTLCIFDRIIFTCCSVPSSLYCWTMSIFVFLPEFYHIAAAKFFKFMWLSQASCNCLNFLAIIWKCQAAVSSLCVGSLCSTFSFLEGLDAAPRCLFSLSNCMCDRFSVYLTWNLLS